MDAKLKQRLIGAAVIIALGVIFIPMFFTGKGVTPNNVSVSTQIPTPPTGQQVSASQAQQLQLQQPTSLSVNTANQPQANQQQSLLAAATNPQAPKLRQLQALQQSSVPSAINQGQQVAATAAKVEQAARSAKIQPIGAKHVTAPKAASKQVAKQVTKPMSKQPVAKRPVAQKVATATAKAIHRNIAAKPARHHHRNRHHVSRGNGSWAVQLGSFSNAKNAARLVRKLRSRGYAAYMRHVTNSTGSHTRVYVGPNLKREKAATLVAKLDKLTRLRGIVVKYQPLQL